MIIYVLGAKNSNTTSPLKEPQKIKNSSYANWFIWQQAKIKNDQQLFPENLDSLNEVYKQTMISHDSLEKLKPNSTRKYITPVPKYDQSPSSILGKLIKFNWFRVHDS